MLDPAGLPPPLFLRTIDEPPCVGVGSSSQILYGTTRFLSKRTKKAAADAAAPASDNRAAVYSEQTTAVYQEASPVYSEVTEAVTPRKNAKKKKPHTT